MRTSIPASRRSLPFGRWVNGMEAPSPGATVTEAAARNDAACRASNQVGVPRTCQSVMHAARAQTALDEARRAAMPAKPPGHRLPGAILSHQAVSQPHEETPLPPPELEISECL